MAGERGPLRLVPHLASVPDVIAGSAAANVPALAPQKPEAVASDGTLSALWDQIVPELDRAGLVSPSDAPSVEMCLRHFRAARDASDELAGSGAAVSDHNHGGVKKNPAEAVFRAESEMFLKYAQQLGMTFVSRARTPGRTGADDGDENPFAPTGTRP